MIVLFISFNLYQQKQSPVVVDSQWLFLKNNKIKTFTCKIHVSNMMPATAMACHLQLVE